MKNFLLTIVIVLLFCNFSYSQITIDQSDFANPSDTFLVKVNYNPTIPIDLSPGENKVWDFSGLENDMLNFVCYKPVSYLDFADQFPLSQYYTYGPGWLYAGPSGIAPNENNWGYMLFFNNPDGLFIEGFYSDYGLGYRATYNSPPEMLMFAPATYSNSQMHNSYWQVAIDNNPLDHDSIYRRNVEKSLLVDAWGTLTTVFGTYEVIRVHETGFSIDSLFISFGEITLYRTQFVRDTLNNYYFWAKEIGNPLVTIKCDGRGNIKEVNYLTAILQTGIETPSDNSNQITIFPNPVIDKLYFNIENKVEVFDIQGKTVLKTNHAIRNIDISILKKGIYFIKFGDNSVHKFVKE